MKIKLLTCKTIIARAKSLGTRDACTACSQGFRKSVQFGCIKTEETLFSS